MKEINDLIKEMDEDINKIMKGTTQNTHGLLKKKLKPFHKEFNPFSAVLRCDFCGKDHRYKTMDEVQYDKNDPAKGASILNAVLNLEPNQEKIHTLARIFHEPNTTEEQKLAIQKQIKYEQDHYPKYDFVCFDCATNIQKLFKYSVDKYVEKIRDGQLSTSSLGVTQEEKAALTALTTDKF
jgi:hypothetical protein